MQISYDYYRVFYYAAKYRSFTAAATALLNNQPNITRAIKALESALGCTLFLRSNHGVTLTPEGEKLYTHIQIAFEHIETGEEEILREKTLQSGMVSVGATEIALHCLLLPVLKAYRAHYPGVKIHITNHSTSQAIDALKSGLLDLAVVTAPNPHFADLSERTIRSVPEVAICGNQYRHLLGRTVSLRELAKLPIVSLNVQSRTYERYAAIFGSYGLPFTPDIEAATTDQILPMVRSDLGIGFVPKQMVPNEPDIHEIQLKESLPPRDICLLRQKNHSLSIAARKLEELILSTQETT